MIKIISQYVKKTQRNFILAEGNISNVSLIVYDKAHFDRIRQVITAEKVEKWFGELLKREVVRYELPQLGALNFVLHLALSGGVTSSTALDKYGKCLSSFLLDMEI